MRRLRRPTATKKTEERTSRLAPPRGDPFQALGPPLSRGPPATLKTLETLSLRLLTPRNPTFPPEATIRTPRR